MDKTQQGYVNVEITDGLAKIEFGYLQVSTKTDDLVPYLMLKTLQDLNWNDHDPEAHCYAGDGNFVDHAGKGLFSGAAHPFWYE